MECLCEGSACRVAEINYPIRGDREKNIRKPLAFLKENLTADQFYSEARKTLRKIATACYTQAEGEERALCLIIDELDQMKDAENFASFWKTLQELLMADGINNMMLIFVGMPDMVTILNDDYEFFLRTFSPIQLDKMNEEDARNVVHKAMSKTDKKISSDALERILYYS